MRTAFLLLGLVLALAGGFASSGFEVAAQGAGPHVASPRAVTAASPVPSAMAAAPGPIDGTWRWIMERQRELTQAMTAAVRRLQGESFWTAAAQLGLISFLYGVFHAAGPGHGKFVISSYALANARTLRRGVLVSFMAAFLQAVSAIALVGVLALVVKATSLEIRRAEAWLETASWGLIALLGAWLLYTRLSPLLRRQARHDHDHDHDHEHGPGCTHDHQPLGSHRRMAPVSASTLSCTACGHTHAPAPDQLEGPWSWRQAWTMAFAVGVRPCTGAIAVLLFSLGTGLLAAGIFATFAMAVGTALTVSALATLAVVSRDLAARISGGGAWTGRIQTAAGLVGSFLVFALGASFFVASLNGTGPL